MLDIDAAAPAPIDAPFFDKFFGSLQVYLLQLVQLRKGYGIAKINKSDENQFLDELSFVKQHG
jgi:hypothetical protein